MKAVCVHETGDPGKLQYQEIPVPSIGPGQVLVKIRSIGLNFIDIYFRKGLYVTNLPFIPGMEASGIVEETGEGISEFQPGDRVAFAGTIGAYAEYICVDAAKLIRLPETMDLESAAAVLLQGMTAHYLTHSTFRLKSRDTVLLHAAAGGVGLLLTQIARQKNARVIGTVSTEEKAQLAREAGAEHVILYDETNDFAAEVRKITDGTGVDVVYDSVGRATFAKSLDCLRPRGTLVLYGQSSGPVPPIDPNLLNSKGSLFLTRPGIAHYIATRDELLWRSGEIFRWVLQDNLRVRIDSVFSLSESDRAHQLLESRATKGKVLLYP